MATKRTTKSKKTDELKRQGGEPLPKREVMSVLSVNPGLIAIPEDPTLPGHEDQPGPVPIEDPPSKS